MIRTAILGGLLLIMISIAYSRTGALPDIAPVKAIVQEQPAKPVKAPAPKSESRLKQSVFREEAAPPARHRETRKVEEEEEVLSEPVAPAPAPAIHKTAEAAPAPVVEAQPEAKPVRKEPELVPAAVPPVNLLKPVEPQAVAEEAQPAVVAKPARPSAPAIEEAKAPLPSADELPLINVPARPVVMPWDAPPRARTTNTASLNDAVIGADQGAQTAPKFMTPQERSRELHRLAREMEETFISKLAR